MWDKEWRLRSKSSWQRNSLAHHCLVNTLPLIIIWTLRGFLCVLHYEALEVLVVRHFPSEHSQAVTPCFKIYAQPGCLSPSSSSIMKMHTLHAMRVVMILSSNCQQRKGTCIFPNCQTITPIALFKGKRATKVTMVTFMSHFHQSTSNNPSPSRC